MRDLIAALGLIVTSILGISLFGLLVFHGEFVAKPDFANSFELGACIVFFILGIERLISWFVRHAKKLRAK